MSDVVQTTQGNSDIVIGSYVISHCLHDRCGGIACEPRTPTAGPSRSEHIPEQQGSEAVLTLDTAGRFIDANPAALELFGVSLIELRASAPDRFAIRPTIAEEQTALRVQWETGGSQP